ncbi:MAG: sigma-70 family RNA polymerase sigma factor [Planctomycetes bacterium]|nr:sigma-70 family RNA polymerase sigma factor [Planctomycetota bacterium]
MEKTAGVLLYSDPAAFFREVYPALFRFVSSATGADDANVEDIVQETLLRAWRDRDEFRYEASPMTWILAIAKKRTLDFHRHLSRPEAAEVAGRVAARLDAELVPEDLLHEAEMKRRVRTALDELPAEYGDILVRRYYHGHRIRRIARELRETEAAVESRLRRARDAFRIRLQQGVGDHAEP